ncbi:MAG: hypothetical protein HOV97_19460 [Nonomuraea sp.]|nr:hypothetical protein [Nonomuraea sp.]
MSRRVAQIEARFGAEVAAAWRRYHIAAQLTRLVSGVLGSVLLAAVHGGVTDWTSLVPVATGALWAGLEQIWPQVPWKMLLRRGARSTGAATVADPAAPSG